MHGSGWFRTELSWELGQECVNKKHEATLFAASVMSRQACVAKVRVACKPKLGDTKEDQPLSAKVNDRLEVHSLSRDAGCWNEQSVHRSRCRRRPPNPHHTSLPLCDRFAAHIFSFRWRAGDAKRPALAYLCIRERGRAKVRCMYS